MTAKNILITGMTGLIGQAVRKQLEPKYNLTALNRGPIEGVKCHQADIADLAAIEPAFEGRDVVVHLAARVATDATWEELLPANVIGTHNVFEAARRARVKRVVFASSGATISGCERDEPYRSIAAGDYDNVPPKWRNFTHESTSRTSGLYGSTKVWGEALARHYSDTHGISVICLRIGAVNREDRPKLPRHFSVWCSQRDIAQMVERSVEAPESVKFDTFYVVSKNKWSYRDISHAREVVGYEPQDAAEDYRGEVSLA